MPGDLPSMLDLFDRAAMADAWKGRWEMEHQRLVFLEATVHEMSMGHRAIPGDPWTCRDCGWGGQPMNPYPPTSTN